MTSPSVSLSREQFNQAIQNAKHLGNTWIALLRQDYDLFLPAVATYTTNNLNNGIGLLVGAVASAEVLCVINSNIDEPDFGIVRALTALECNLLHFQIHLTRVNPPLACDATTIIAMVTEDADNMRTSTVDVQVINPNKLGDTPA